MTTDAHRGIESEVERMLQEKYGITDEDIALQFGDFPWGEVKGVKVIAGYQVIEHIDRDGETAWLVNLHRFTGHSFKTEARAAIFAGLMAEGVDINNAGRLVSGMLDGFIEEKR